ncbi:hypothetical protein DFH11DRAFT_76609 [Phellopilus nigrolimitatus]|nr:hypothetical protein DFH11DRAFT_76609 [Phellopilus nigrolimitatus]
MGRVHHARPPQHRYGQGAPLQAEKDTAECEQPRSERLKGERALKGGQAMTLAPAAPTPVPAPAAVRHPPRPCASALPAPLLPMKRGQQAPRLAVSSAIHVLALPPAPPAAISVCAAPSAPVPTAPKVESEMVILPNFSCCFTINSIQTLLFFIHTQQRIIMDKSKEHGVGGDVRGQHSRGIPPSHRGRPPMARGVYGDSHSRSAGLRSSSGTPATLANTA